MGANLLEIKGFEWGQHVIAKIVSRHGVSADEVEEIFYNKPLKIRSHKNVYHAFGRTDAGRYLLVVFYIKIYLVRVITARPMTISEKRLFRR